jgi:hypothetical protein
MSGYSSEFWLALCASLTGLGLVLTVMVGRRRSVRAMLHGAAWSLIPIAAYLTGSTQMFWRIGEAIGKWASGFIFSDQRYAGIGVAALIVVLFAIGGSRQRRRQARAKRQEGRERKLQSSQAAGDAVGATGATQAIGAGRTGAGAQSWEHSPPAQEPQPARRGGAPSPSRGSRRDAAPAGKGAGPGSAGTGSAGGGSAGLGDMSEIEEILRKRGIT